MCLVHSNYDYYTHFHNVIIFFFFFIFGFKFGCTLWCGSLFFLSSFPFFIFHFFSRLVFVGCLLMIFFFFFFCSFGLYSLHPLFHTLLRIKLQTEWLWWLGIVYIILHDFKFMRWAVGFFFGRDLFLLFSLSKNSSPFIILIRELWAADLCSALWFCQKKHAHTHTPNTKLRPRIKYLENSLHK